MHILVTSINGPLVAGLVEDDTLDKLMDRLNGDDGVGRMEAPRYFTVRDPVTGKETLVPNGIGIIAEHG